MARVVLAPALARWLPQAGDGELAVDVPADTVGAALAALFERHPVLRGYVVDERGAVRHHVALFVDGRSLARKTHLDQPLAPGAQLHVMQALSGG